MEGRYAWRAASTKAAASSSRFLGDKASTSGTGHPRCLRIPHAPDASPYLEEALQWLPDHESEVLQPEIPAPPSTHARAHILVADDNADMRRCDAPPA